MHELNDPAETERTGLEADTTFAPAAVASELEDIETVALTEGTEDVPEVVWGTAVAWAHPIMSNPVDNVGSTLPQRRTNYTPAPADAVRYP